MSHELIGKGANGFKVLPVDSSIGDIIVRPGKMETDVKRPRGKAGISGASVAYVLGLMETMEITSKRAVHLVKEWEHSVMDRNVTIPVSKDGIMGGELLDQASDFENMGLFGVKTYNNAIELERELHRHKGKFKKVEESIPLDKAEAVVIVRSNDWTVEEKNKPIIRVDQTRIGREINSLAFSLAAHEIIVDPGILKSNVYNQTKTVIKLNAASKPIYEVSFKADKPIVKPQGNVKAAR